MAAGRMTTPGAPLNVPLVMASKFLARRRSRLYARDDGTPTWASFEAAVGVPGERPGRGVQLRHGGDRRSARSPARRRTDRLARGLLPGRRCHDRRRQSAWGRWTVRSALPSRTPTRGVRPPATRISSGWSRRRIRCSMWPTCGASPPLDRGPGTPPRRRQHPRRPSSVSNLSTLGRRRGRPVGHQAPRRPLRPAVRRRHRPSTGPGWSACVRSRKLHGATPGALGDLPRNAGESVPTPCGPRPPPRPLHELARRPEAHEHVGVWCGTPASKSHPTHRVAAEQLGTFGSVISFDMVGGAAAADEVCRRVELVHHATSFGAVESTIERRAAVSGQEHLPPGLLRLSAGNRACRGSLGRPAAGAPPGVLNGGSPPHYRSLRSTSAQLPPGEIAFGAVSVGRPVVAVRRVEEGVRLLASELSGQRCKRRWRLTWVCSSSSSSSGGRRSMVSGGVEPGFRCVRVTVR